MLNSKETHLKQFGIIDETMLKQVAFLCEYGSDKLITSRHPNYRLSRNGNDGQREFLILTVKVLFATQPTYHMHGRESEVKRRIWEAMVKTILPVIEEVRNLLVFSEMLVFVNEARIINKDSYIENNSDFEIGQIHYCIQNRYIHVTCIAKNKRTRILKLVKLCREVRNDIAHLDIPQKRNLEILVQEANDLHVMLK